MMNCEVTNFIRGANPIWSFVDLVGKQLDDTYWLYVLTNEIPYIPATVYQDPSGTIPWPNPIQFLANGTLPDNIYFANNTFYRLEIRHNITPPPTQADPLIYEVNDYNPSNFVVGPTPGTGGPTTTNQIANPQFAVINFESPLTLTAVTNPPPIDIAPGWTLNLTGTGSVTITQVPLNDTNANPTNAPYALRMQFTGWANPPVLKQVFQQNGMNWANKTVATSFTALANGNPVMINATIVDSTGATQALLTTATLTNNFAVYQGHAVLPASTNANLPPNASLSYNLTILNGALSDIYLTSVQVTVSDEQVNVPYQQDTVDREIDHLFHYYLPKLEFKPIPSYLVGWDFPLNPAQFNGATVGAQATGNNKSFYAWDQTIIFQTVSNGVTVARNADGGIQLTAAITGQMAMIQYLDKTQARELLAGHISVAIKAHSSAAQTATVSLWACTDANLPSVATGTNNSIVATLDATGNVLTQNGSWTQLSQRNGQQQQINLTTTPTEFYLSYWKDNITTPVVTTANFFAIVIATNSVANPNTVTFDWVSVNLGEIPTRPAPLTQAQTNLACEEFYASSFQPGIVPAQNVGTDTGYSTFNLVKVTGSMGIQAWFPVTMRAVPTIVTYNPSAANAQIRDLTAGDFSGTSPGTSTTQKNTFITGAPNGASTVGNICAVHWSADARLGIVN